VVSIEVPLSAAGTDVGGESECHDIRSLPNEFFDELVLDVRGAAAKALTQLRRHLGSPLAKVLAPSCWTGSIDSDEYSLARRFIEAPEGVDGRAIGEVPQDQAARPPRIRRVVFDALAGARDLRDLVNPQPVGLGLLEGVRRNADEVRAHRLTDGAERTAFDLRHNLLDAPEISLRRTVPYQVRAGTKLEGFLPRLRYGSLVPPRGTRAFAEDQDVGVEVRPVGPHNGAQLFVHADGPEKRPRRAELARRQDQSGTARGRPLG